MVPGMFKEEGHNLYLAEEIKKHVKHSHVVSVGAHRDPKKIEDILAAGKVDMIAVCRAVNADPQFVNKLKRNQEEEIRPCLRCNACIANYQTRITKCAINPTLDRPEDEVFPFLPTTPKRVLIAGGGPAGGGRGAAVPGGSPSRLGGASLWKISLRLVRTLVLHMEQLMGAALQRSLQELCNDGVPLRPLDEGGAVRLIEALCPLLLQKGDKGGPAGFGFRFRQQKKPFASPNRDERLSKVSRGTTLISRLTACPHCRYGRYSGLYPPAVTVGLRLRLLDNSFSVLLQGQFKAFAQPLLTTQRLSAC